MTSSTSEGLSLAPFRGLRFAVPEQRLGRLLCPPYDVIDDAERAHLLEVDSDNAVSVVLPRPEGQPTTYEDAAKRLDAWIAAGLLQTDDTESLYVYEMRTPDGSATRGLIGAVELRVAADGVILPHEHTMAGPVADRLALMTATDANLEPIYLVYDGGGAASAIVSQIDDAPASASIAIAMTPDGITHRLWAISDPERLEAIAMDLRSRRAMIADGHHRYATYLELQRLRRAEFGPGPWDRGLALLVDSSTYGPRVHAIHRVLPTLALTDALAPLSGHGRLTEVASPQEGLIAAQDVVGFAAVITDGVRSLLVTDLEPVFSSDLLDVDEPKALGELDVTVLHRGLASRAWRLSDDEDHVWYSHSELEAIDAARSSGGTAVLLRPTPVDAVAAVAAAGARMPRKSTLFTPKPASGIVIRRFAEQGRG